MALWFMSTMSGLTARMLSLTLGLILIGALICISRVVRDPLRKLPGPFWARFSRLWYVKHVHKGHQDLDEVQLHKKYGKIVRLAPGQFSFSDISAAKIIYDHASKFAKNDFYAPFGPPGTGRANIFQETNIAVHSQHKRKIANLYSMTSIVSYEPFVDECMQSFLDELDHFASISKAINVPAWMQYYAFDVIGAITTGEKYGFMKNGSDFLGIIKELNEGQSFGTHLGSFDGSLFKYVAAIATKLGKQPPFQVVQRHAVDSLTRKQQDLENGKSLQESIGRQDFAEKLLMLKAQGKISDYDLMGAIRTNIAAGSDTTAISLSAVMYNLLRSPMALARLRQEVDHHKNEQDSTEFTSFAQAQEMPYLQAVIKEALRLHPAVGMQLPRVVPEGGATLAGHFFPAGTTVGINPWVIHRQTDLFGQDAEQFRPERWLEDEENAKEMDRYLYTFGGGARSCIGKHISMLEIQKLIPELLWRYDFEFEDKEEECKTLNRFFVYERYSCFVRMRGEKTVS